MENKTKSTKKIVRIVLLVLILAAGGFGVWKVMQPKVTAVITAAVERRDVAQTIVISGRLEANDTFETALSLSQKVQTVVKKEGDLVKAGDVLVQLDTTDLAYQLDKAVLNLDLLKLSTVNARAQAAISLDTAKVAYDQAVKNYEDARKKYNNGTITRLVRDQSETAMKTAENQVKLAQATYDGLDLDAAGSDRRKQVEAATLDIENLKRKIADSTIRSAIAGQVSMIEARAGQFPTQSTSRIQVVDLSRLMIKADVDQIDVVRLQAGQKASVKVKGLTRTFVGSITDISEVVSSQSGAATDPKYEVTITLDPSAPENADAEGSGLKQGFEVDASVAVQERKAVLAVPLTSVQTKSGQSTVWLAVDGKAVQRSVKTGIKSSTLIEVAEGLSEGDRVITAPLGSLQEGALVTVG